MGGVHFNPPPSRQEPAHRPNPPIYTSQPIRQTTAEPSGRRASPAHVELRCRGHRRRQRGADRRRSPRARPAPASWCSSTRPSAMRGGNSRHTRNLRAMHTAPTSVLTEAYLEDEYWDDLLRVTGGQTDEHLARLTIRATQDALPFMERCGVRFQPSPDRHAQPLAHQRLLPRRRQGAGERLLRHRRTPRRRTCSTTPR